MNEKRSKRIVCIVLIVLLLLFGAIALIKVLSDEDDWICDNGSWVKHGSPSSAMPSTPCESQLVGGDEDEHGCIGSADYSWCEEKQKCLRSWEENCSN